ncbi:MAG: CehA/McbA family metallohydrolase [Firmicutes bacterium]|nr:CehA/McbA family metallohydrolase [Bacillota bacterium]
MAGYYDYAGAIHVHSKYSDGLSDVPAVIEAANKAGCDYLIITDHNTRGGSSYEGWHGRTMVLVGEEITVGNEEGHYLGLNLTDKVAPNQTPQKTIDLVKQQGGLGFIAHPIGIIDHNVLQITPLPWQDWATTGFDGIEIWNYGQDWIENFQGSRYYLPGLANPDTSIDGPPAATLRKWDALQKRRKVIGIGCVDAHGYYYSYRRMFKTLRTHLLLKNRLSGRPDSFARDKEALYSALKRGNCYFSYDYRQNGKGFMFSGDNGSTRVIMGEGLRLKDQVRLKASTPRPGLLRIVRDGRVAANAEGVNTLTLEVKEPGAYRVEALFYGSRGMKKAYIPWIYSNPIYIR